jgi:hypothetical protein
VITPIRHIHVTLSIRSNAKGQLKHAPSGLLSANKVMLPSGAIFKTLPFIVSVT